MAFNGVGIYVPVPAPDFPAIAGTTILASQYNAEINDIATALSTCLTRDGQSTATADQPMGGFKHTNVSIATARNQYARAAEVQDGALMRLSSVAGSNTITTTIPFALPAYVISQFFTFIPAATNTTAVTINISGIGAKSITKNGAAALVAGDLLINAAAIIFYDGVNFQLLNPPPPPIPAPVVVVYPGTVSLFAGPAAPTGYLFCTGGLVSRVTYASLFAAIGITWGAGDGVTTFALPDMSSRVPIGVGTGAGLTPRALAGSGGTETHTLIVNEMPAHSHDTVFFVSTGGGETAASASAANSIVKSTTVAGGGASHNNMQPFLGINYIIKT